MKVSIGIRASEEQTTKGTPSIHRREDLILQIRRHMLQVLVIFNA